MADTESSEALQLRNPKLEHEKQPNDSEGDDENEEDKEGKQGDEEKQKRVIELQIGKLLSSERRREATGGSDLETLAVPPSYESVGNDQCAELQGSCATQMASEAKSKDPLVSSDKEIIAREAVQAAQSETEKENQLPVSLCPSSLSEVSPTSVSQTLSSTPTTVPEQRLLSVEVNNLQVPAAVEKKNHFGGKTVPAVSVARSPASDGYNWRKYGQKQVKSPTGSRSYYRCSHSACGAKKIECCDNSGHVIEIVYRSQHSHNPPRKNNSMSENKFLSSSEPAVENSVPEQHISVVNDSDPSFSSKGPQQEAPCPAEKKQQNSCDLSDNGKVILKEEHINELETKKRMKKGDLACQGSPVKPGKKPKFVVHAAGDVGISGDGYRWRKYGQKMVKGNPHPRNYYRCTSAGCPVRKHIETAVDNSDAVIITYKGVHDHDMPVPKKRHAPPSARLMAAAAPTSMNNSQLKKGDSPQKQKTSTQWSVDTEGELTGEALELGGEKAMESARTLLSIGFEIKPC